MDETEIAIGPPITLFYIYAREDERLRKKLDTHLGLLKQQGFITTWHDRDITAGTEWASAIDAHLDEAQIILLLVSASFLASPYCYREGMMHALKRHEAGNTRVIPIILRDVDWTGAPFGKLQTLPTEKRSVTGRGWHNRDEPFADITREIRKIIKELHTQSNKKFEQKSFYALLSSRSIMSTPPLTDAGSIEQRVIIVKAIFTQLMQPDINALALIGMGGIGKSTLAALLYRFVEAQHAAGMSSFAAPPLWLSVDITTTFADLAGTICQALDNPMPNLGNLAPGNQVFVLNNLLAQTKYPQLIILDQFENLLDWETGRALENRPGIGEWLDALNSQLWKSGCRLVMTSRPYPRGERQEAAMGIQGYSIEGLTLDEGVDLLRKRGIQTNEADQRKVVKACNGHPLSLELLIYLIQEYKLPLTSMLGNITLWSGDIAKNLLNNIFGRLSEVQRDLLRAFSIYRTPVTIEATQAIYPACQLISLEPLLKQHLIQAIGEGRYQLHIIVATYAKEHFVQNDKKANDHAVIKAHEKVSRYYMQQAAKLCPPQDQRQRVSEVQPLIEAIWHSCQATQWRQAYDLMVYERIFTDLKIWGSYTDILELYELMLPLDKWQPDDQQCISIYNDLGRIYSDLDNKKRALVCYKDALEISKRQNDSKKQARTLNNLGWIYVELEDRGQAEEYFQQSLKLSRNANDYRQEASTLNGFGRLSDNRGEKELARSYYKQALIIYTEHEERETLTGKGWTFNNLGKVNADLGHRELALDYFQQALTIRRDILSNRWEEGRTLKNLGEVYLLLGRTEESLKCLEAALDISKKVGDCRGEGRTLNVLGQTYLALGEKAKATTCLEQALNIHREVGDCRNEARALEGQAELLSNPPEQQDKVIENYKTALELYRKMGDRWREAIVLQKFGIFYFQQNSYDIAFSCFILAENIFSQVQSPNHGDIQKWLDDLREKLGEELFVFLSAREKLEAQHIVNKVLYDHIDSDKQNI